MATFKWKYLELKARYEKLEEETLSLATRCKSASFKLSSLKAEREILASKCTDIRIRRSRMIRKVPNDAYALFSQQNRMFLRSVHPQATRRELEKIQRDEWEVMDPEMKQKCELEYQKYSQRLSGDLSSLSFRMKRPLKTGPRSRTASKRGRRSSGGGRGRSKRRLEDEAEEDDAVDEESQSSGVASDDDSDDNMAQLPTGAFG